MAVLLPYAVTVIGLYIMALFNYLFGWEDIELICKTFGIAFVVLFLFIVKEKL
tara:strand:+ start:239 stop:397 length:159 start_codon:yes stop_codon:yes gene_type:complete